MDIVRDPRPYEAAAHRIEQALAAHPDVLLLLSGGSATNLYTILAQWPLKLPQRILVGQVDERYGIEPNHANANWPGIVQTGITTALRPQEAKPILTGKTLEETVAEYEAWLKVSFDDKAVYKLAVLGMGEDGHIAGILPNADSQAFARNFEASEALVVGYESGDQYGLRVTLTPGALLKLDEALVIATSPTKQSILSELDQSPPPPLHHLPATILRDLPNACIITGEETG